MADDTQKAPTWPYTSFKSLTNVIDRFKENGLPPRIDRSVLGGSEGQKTQIIGAMRFFGFVKQNGDVTDALTRMVNADQKQRQQFWKELLTTRYPQATELAAVNATTRQLEETLTGIAGETQRKAVAFYLQAAKEVGHPTSKHFKIPPFIARSGGTRRQASSVSPLNGGDEEEVVTPASDPKTRYIEMLMDKASKSSDAAVEKDLLDRIERILSLDAKGGNEPQ
jgi:hypothetical protein